MNEKASRKNENEEQISKIGSDLPGIPEGEELALDPTGGDEIDPVDRWWDDSDSEEREKGVNRRVEELPARKPRLPLARNGERTELTEAVEGDEPQKTAHEDKPGPVEIEEPVDEPVLKAVEPIGENDKAEETADAGRAAGGKPSNEESRVSASAPAAPKLEVAAAPKEERAVASPPPRTKSLEDLFDEETVGEHDESPTNQQEPSTEKEGESGPGTEEPKGEPGLDKTSSPDTRKDEEELDDFLLKVASGDADVPLAKADDQKRKAGCWTVFATLFFVVSLMLFAAIGAAGYFAWTRVGKLEEEIAALAKKNLEERGIFLEYGDWSYQFPRGLVFDEMTVYDDETRSRPVLKLTSPGVNFDVFGLFKDRTQLGAVEISLKDSDLTLYDTDGAAIEISDLDGEILAGSGSIEFKRLSAQMWGYLLTLRGTVELPEKEELAKSEVKTEKKQKIVSPINMEALRQLEPWLAVESAGGDPPALSLNFRMDSGGDETIEFQGSFQGEAVTWRGIEFVSVAATFRLDPETGDLHFPNFQIGYGEGIIAGSGTYASAENRLEIGRMQSSVDPIALLASYDAELGEKLTSFRLVDAPSVRIRGTVPLDDPAQAELAIQYEHRQGLVYLDGERELPVRDIRGKFNYSRGSLETNDAAAGLFGGDVSLNGAMRLTAEERPFNGLIEITRMPLDRAAAWFGQEQAGLSGLLTLSFRGVGYADKAKIRGGGNLRIDEASLPAFPVLGPVQALVGRVVPAFRAQEGGSVKGAYIIESGVLLTSDLTMENGGAKIATNGSMKLETKETAFTSKAMLTPSLAAATGLSGKAITIEGRGPLDGPSLKVTEFPIEFAAENLGEVLGTSTESLGLLEEILSADGNAVDVISGKIEEATGITIDPAINDLFKSLLGGGPETVTEAPPTSPN